VIHSGFLKPPEVIQEKLDLYDAVTEKYSKKHPDDPQPIYNMAMSLYNYGEFDKCKKYLKRAIRLAGPNRFYQAHCQLATLCQLEALASLLKANLILPEGHPWKARVVEQINQLQNRRRLRPWPK
jgi:tetratricopeptide (TPR) repeat protein